ncbi:hypothetical protein YC2023_010539 [Brassica napus]
MDLSGSKKIYWLKIYVKELLTKQIPVEKLEIKNLRIYVQCREEEDNSGVNHHESFIESLSNSPNSKCLEWHKLNHQF